MPHDDVENIGSNRSTNPHIDQVVAARDSRRSVVTGGTAAAALTFLAGPQLAGAPAGATLGSPRGDGPRIDFTSVPTSTADSLAGQAALSSGSLSDDSAWALWQLHNGLFTLNTMSLATVLLCLSIAGSRAGLIRGWQKKVGLTAAVVMAAEAVLTPWPSTAVRSACSVSAVSSALPDLVHAS